ncbi:MAG TPA: hypothetical protein VNO34_07030 [Actinomycetota bacterium]|nr:hypothetical protein [Actinomycetota bacterium]
MACGVPLLPEVVAAGVPPGCLAQALAWAARHRHPLPRPAAPAIDEGRAYEVQRRFVEEWSRWRGDPVGGFKVSMTSPETQALAGGRGPAYGRLLTGQVLDGPARVSLAATFSPRLELELQFVVREELPPGATAEEVLARCDVAPGFEVPDSRFRDWFGQLSAPEVIADDAVAGLVVVGAAWPASRVEVGAVRAELRRDGEALVQGSASAVMGDPAEAVAWLARELARAGERLAPGTVVSSGTFALPVPLEVGEYVGVFEPLGEVRLSVTG